MLRLPLRRLYDRLPSHALVNVVKYKATAPLKDARFMVYEDEER